MMRLGTAITVMMIAEILTSGCAGQDGPEASDSVAVDTSEACNCLGGTPVNVLQNLSLNEDINDELYAWPGLSGQFWPAPNGGFIIDSRMSCSFENEYGERLTLVGPDGKVLWNDDCVWELDFENNTQEECPTFRGALPDYFVTELSNHYKGRDYSGAVVWRDSPPGFDPLCDVTAPLVPGTTDRYQVLRTAVEGSGSNPGQMKYVVSVARCTIDGELRFNVAAPGYFSFRSVAAADDEGVLVLYRPGESPDPADTYGIRGIRVSFDGEVSGPFEIFPWPVESLDRNLCVWAINQTSEGFLLSVAFRESAVEPWARVFAHIGSDGKVRWIHEGEWFEDGSDISGGWLTVNADGTVDCLRAQINYDTGLTLPRLTRIKADGSGIVFDRKEIVCPTGVPGEWDIVGRWDVKEGILVLGYQTASGSPDDGISFVALYDRDYEIRWVKSYGPTYSHPQLVRDGQDWLLSWDVHADWRSITGVPGKNMSIARFAGVCTQKDCGKLDQSMNQGQ